MEIMTRRLLWYNQYLLKIGAICEKLIYTTVIAYSITLRIPH